MRCSFFLILANLLRCPLLHPTLLQFSFRLMLTSFYHCYFFIFIQPSKLIAFIKFYFSQINHKNPHSSSAAATADGDGGKVTRNEGWRLFSSYFKLEGKQSSYMQPVSPPGGDAMHNIQRRDNDDDAVGC